MWDKKTLRWVSASDKMSFSQDWNDDINTLKCLMLKWGGGADWDIRRKRQIQRRGLSTRWIGASKTRGTSVRTNPFPIWHASHSHFSLDVVIGGAAALPLSEKFRWRLQQVARLLSFYFLLNNEPHWHDVCPFKPNICWSEGKTCRDQLNCSIKRPMWPYCKHLGKTTVFNWLKNNAAGSQQ